MKSTVRSATPGFEADIQGSKEDLFLLDALDQQINGVLEQIQYIVDLLATHKTVAPVEDLQREIKKALNKIQDRLNQAPGVERDTDQPVNAPAGGPSGLEANPLIEDMGGMPLEAIASDWESFAAEAGIRDKAELENMVKKIKDKLQAKLKHKARLSHRMKLSNKPSLRHTAKPGQSMTPKFKQVKQLQAALKYILKETPAPPAPAPRIHEVPRPRPGGL